MKDNIKKISNMYLIMYKIRLFEEMLLELFSLGILNGTTHTSIGQEADSVGIIYDLDKNNDYVFSNHRGHGHFIAFTGKIKELLFEIMGLDDGICGGIGGSQHLFDNGHFYSNGIQGGMVPIAVGNAWATKKNNNDSVTVVFIGDGTLGEGIVYESLNFASLYKLPILFVVENNYYAQSTPSYLQISGSIISRFQAFNIDTTEITTTDVIEINKTANLLFEEIRREKVPKCLIINTYRFAPHSKGDDFRDKNEIEEHRKKDPLKILKLKFPKINYDLLEQQVSKELLTLKNLALKKNRYYE